MTQTTVKALAPKFDLRTGKYEHLKTGHYDKVPNYLINTDEGEWISETQAYKYKNILTYYSKKIEVFLHPSRTGTKLKT